MRLGRIITGTSGRDKSIYENMFEKNIVAEFYRGSIAHNMYIGDPSNPFPSDDKDVMVVYAYPIQYYLTLESYNQAKDVFEKKYEDIDVVGYELKKMFHLLAGLNPNATPALFTKDEYFGKLSDAWKFVRENRGVFTHRTRIRDVYLGYAQAQYRRMIDKKSWFGYMGAKRKTLYESLGYDAKYASHSIRLLRIGCEYLTLGEPQVFRTTDREELLEIKEGKWSLEKIQQLYAAEMLNLEKAFRESKLPDKDTKHNVNKLLYEVMGDILDSTPPATAEREK